MPQQQQGLAQVVVQSLQESLKVRSPSCWPIISKRLHDASVQVVMRGWHGCMKNRGDTVWTHISERARVCEMDTQGVRE